MPEKLGGLFFFSCGVVAGKSDASESDFFLFTETESFSVACFGTKPFELSPFPAAHAAVFCPRASKLSTVGWQ